LRQLIQQNNSSSNKTSLKYWFCLLSLAFLLSFVNLKQANCASLKENTSNLIEYLGQEKLHITQDINESKLFVPPTSSADFKEKSQRISTLLTINQAKIQSLEGFIENQDKERFKLTQKLKHLQQLPLATAEIAVQKRVSKVENLIALNTKTIDQINENLSMAEQLQSLLNERMKELDAWNANYILEQQLLVVVSKKQMLKQELHALYQININHKNTKHVVEHSDSHVAYDANILINNQHIALIHQQMSGFDIQKEIIRAKLVLLKNYNIKTIQSVIDVYNEAIVQYAKIDETYTQMQVFFNNESSLGLDKNMQGKIRELQTTLALKIKDNKAQETLFKQELSSYQIQLKKLISARQTLAEYNINSWPLILHKITSIPTLFYKYIKILSLKAYDSFLWLDIIPTTILLVALSLLLVFSYVIARFLNYLSNDKERTSLSGHLYDGALTLVQRNIPYLCFIAMLLVVFYITNISFSNYQLLINLILVWVVFRVLILIARLVLLERITDSSGKDVKLYYRLKWLLLFGGWTTALMTFSHLLPMSMIIQDIFNRLFMLFILSVSLVAWKSKDVIPYLLRPLLKAKKRYLKNAVSLVVILLPVTLFTTAVIGLLGYINLAWTMSSYQAYLLLVLVGYVLARGLLFDALDVFSEWMISSLRNGWLWIEVFLKPIDRIMRIALFLLSAVILCQLFGWHSDSVVITSLNNFAHYTIINLSGIHITVESTIEFFILLAIFYWAAKWTREFCYRWLFREAKDPGIRNSLSVFTQYSVILLGSFITLRVLGLDFSGMSVIIGGLAVGMGFGLRDFASNIVGGIMLLIERPVREGDLISIGEYEGQVSHIGIRSMRVSSWDNTEVLIPNAETFNKPFTNWTHQDGIVRTVIPIKVSRSDDPVMIQQLILDVLAIIPEIVSTPPVQVFLKKIDEALIEFEARYFINVQEFNRVEVRSKVLFAITAQFKAAGVRPPIDPITIEFKEGHGEFFTKKQSAEDRE